MRRIFGIAATLLATTVAHAQESAADISAFTVDVNAGAISAGGLVGLEQSAIQQVETSQDLMIALKPFSSGSSSREGFGLAITPGRTAFFGVSSQDYYDSAIVRALTSLTLSYAENGATLSSTKVRKSAVSADMFYYFDKEKDPIVVAHNAFGECDQSDALGKLGAAIRARRRAEAGGDATEISKAKAAEARAQKEYDDLVNQCVVDAANQRSPWNASRIGLSLGTGWIKPEDNSFARESLGRSITVSGVWGRPDKPWGIYYSLRHTANEVDLTTLGSAVQEKDSSLAAVRFVYGTKEDNGDTKVLAEVSNAKKSEPTIANTVFKYAVGIDKKLGKGTWLQFRLGRNRTIDGASRETTGLMNLTFAPSSGLFK